MPARPYGPTGTARAAAVHHRRRQGGSPPRLAHETPRSASRRPLPRSRPSASRPCMRASRVGRHLVAGPALPPAPARVMLRSEGQGRVGLSAAWFHPGRTGCRQPVCDAGPVAPPPGARGAGKSFRPECPVSRASRHPGRAIPRRACPFCPAGREARDDREGRSRRPQEGLRRRCAVRFPRPARPARKRAGKDRGRRIFQDVPGRGRFEAKKG